MQKTELTKEALMPYLKRYIYGESLVSMSKEIGCHYITLGNRLTAVFGKYTDYRYDSVIMYLQKHFIREAVQHFRMNESTVCKYIKSFKKKHGIESVKDAPTDVLCTLKAPFEEDILGGIIKTRTPRHEETKEERIEKARNIHLLVKKRVEECRLQRKREYDNRWLNGTFEP